MSSFLVLGWSKAGGSEERSLSDHPPQAPLGVLAQVVGKEHEGRALSAPPAHFLTGGDAPHRGSVTVLSP